MVIALVETALAEMLLEERLVAEMLLRETVDLDLDTMNTALRVRGDTNLLIHSKSLGQSSLVPHTAHSFAHILLDKAPCRIDRRTPRARPV